MADAKITALTSDAAPTTDDLVVTVNDPGGTPANKKVTLGDILHLFLPSGLVMPHGSRTAPTGWLRCDGSTVSRSTNANLFAAIIPSLGTFTVTIATPAVVSLTAHGLSTGDQVFLTTSSALPTGLTANTLYYAVRVDANSFNLATTRANAYAATKINTSGSQSGTHTCWDCPYGLGDGSTTFTLPDLRGRVIAGLDTTAGTTASRLTLAQAEGVYGNIGATGGEQGHQVSLAEMPGHTHNINVSGVAGITIPVANGGAVGATNTTSAAGSNAAHNTVPPIQLVNFIIKT